MVPSVLTPGTNISIAKEMEFAEGGESFAFLLNVSKLEGATGFNLCPGHEIRRANTHEIAMIKKTLQTHITFPMVLPWEANLHANGTIEALPESEWRYHVIGFQGNNETLVALEEACILAPLEIKIGFVVLRFPEGYGLTVHSGRLFQQLECGARNLALSAVSASDINAIRTIYEQLGRHDPRLVDVGRLARQLQELEAVPSHSPLRFLGYFAVLEGLLTHSPRQTDPYDSITRQIKKKLALLDHRCDPHIDYSPFGGANAETIWTKMYEYRSRLAHGGAPTFDDELQMLRSHVDALGLVKQTVKVVIRQALIEPQLLIDLKDC